MTGWSVEDDLAEAIELPDQRFALGVIWHPEEDESKPASSERWWTPARAGGAARGDRGVEPATEQVMAEVPRAGAEEVDAAVARAKAAFPAWRAVAPADRAALLHGLADALEDRREDLATLEARNAGKPIADARGEMGMVVETFRYYAGAPERLLGPDDPGRRRRRHDLPRAARRGRPDRALELPAADRLLEGGAGAGRRQHASC